MTESGSQQTKLHPNRPPFSLLIVFAGGLLAVLALLLPRYRHYVSTVDDEHRWSHADAPPHREIVWRPAEQIEIEGSVKNQSHIRPQVADSGQSLYFTVHSDNNHLDIVRSKRNGDHWSRPSKVAALNSTADDVGPVMSADGNTLYMYSNRGGGFGGMDLYVSELSGDGWSEPKNLGPTINSPAHEYDPAISPDDQQLYFASNRTTATMDPGASHWKTTLRSDLGQRTFDLYVAQRDAKSAGWKPATPFARCNTAEYNEGSPFVSPDGAFVLFSSDRPTPRREQPNFDLYRARINGPDGRVQNLGSGVNTPASEIEPALSLAGFQLHFSRSSEDADTRYRLHHSTAQEIYHDADWDETSFSSVTSMIANAVKRLFNRVWLLLLLLAALASLVWLIRQIRFRHVAVPGFLLLALALHLLLVAGSFFVFFQQTIADRLRKMLEEEVVATQILTSTVSKSAEQSALESVAELPTPEPISPAKVSRQDIEYSEPSPVEFSKPVAIAGNASLSADAPGERIIATIPLPAIAPQNEDPLQRTRPPIERPADQVELMDTVAVALPEAEQLTPEQPQIDRQQLEPAVEIISPLEVQAAKADRALTESIELTPAPRSETNLRVAPTEIFLQRVNESSTADTENLDPSVPTEHVAAVDAEALTMPSAQVAELPRSEQVIAPAVSQPEPLKLLPLEDHPASPLGAESLVPLLATEITGGSVPADSIASPLKRSAIHERDKPDSESAVATESIKGVESEKLTNISAGQTKVDVQRKEASTDPLPVEPLAVKPAPHALSGPATSTEVLARLPLISRSSVSLDRVAVDTLTRRQPAGSRLYADASVRLQNLLMRRKLDEATKQAVIKEFGGTDETLESIRRGLSWIEQHQHRDGHWSLHDFHKNCQGHKACDGRGGSRSETAGTGLALLPFLGDGNTHSQGPYKDVVGKGITWLVKHQKKDGNLFTGGEANAFMYSHGIATIALCECYGMTGDQSLRGPAQRALDFIVAAQDPKSGGWRYRPRSGGDTSVVGWQVMALKSGQMAELNVPEKTLKDAQRWIDDVAGDTNRVGQFGYQRNHNFSPAMSAEALLCLEYLDNQRESTAVTSSTDYLLKNLPQQGRESSYYWYYATQSMFHLQGEPWQRWNASLHPLLVSSQRRDGPMAGTWDPKDQWEHKGGRIYATSLRVLMLEVYYRHLPLYQVIE